MTIIQAQPLKQFGISGPISALDNEVSVFDGVTGKKIKAATGIICSSSGRLELSSTAPSLILHNTTEEDGDYGRESEIVFKGEQSGTEETTLGIIQVAHDGTADDQKGIMSFKVNDGADGDVPTTAMTILANGNVGIGTDSPGGTLEIGSGQILVPCGDKTTPPFASSINTDVGLYFKADNSLWFAVDGVAVWGAATANVLGLSNDVRLGFSPGSVDLVASDTYLKRTGVNELTLQNNFSVLGTFIAGNIGIGTTATTAKLDINSDILRVRTAKTPATASGVGNQGDWCWDADYMYVCVATNTWKQTALTTW